MRKREFMNRLAQLLTDVPYDERIEALQYYEDYFADAGDDKEQDIINELKSPERIAEIIKKEITTPPTASVKDFNYPEMTVDKKEAEYDDKQMTFTGRMNQATPEEGYEEQYNVNYNYSNEEYEGSHHYNKKRMTGGKLAVLIIGAILFGPLILGIAATLFGAAISIITVFASLFITFFIAGAALIIGGIICMAAGIINMFTMLPRGILIMGAGLVLFGLGFLFITAGILFYKLTKTVFIKIISGVSGLFNKRRAYA